MFWKPHRAQKWCLLWETARAGAEARQPGQPREHRVSEQSETQADFRLSSSLSRIAIELHFDRRNSPGAATRGGHGTGFLWRRGERLFVITNLHNVTAWNRVQSKALSETGFRPNEVEIALRFRWGTDDARFQAGRRGLHWPLYDSDGAPIWLVHPTLGDAVDVVAIEINVSGERAVNDLGEPGTLFTLPANDGQWVNFPLEPGQDAFVLGYPEGLDGGLGFPIWKRASIASEPLSDLDGLPKLYIDTATRKGMSGSCVVVVRRGFAVPDGGTVADALLGDSFQLLGVYSGRVGSDPLGVQLGIVWKRSVIDEIIDGGRRGATPEDSLGESEAT